MRIIAHDDLEKKQLRKIIAHYKTLLKRATRGKAKKGEFAIEGREKIPKKRRTKMCHKKIIIKA
jgi:hypothetical protein